MAIVGELYSFSEEFIENFRVKVTVSGTALEGATVTITSPTWGTFVSTTDTNGFAKDVFLGNTESITVRVQESLQDVDETFNVNYTYNQNLTQYLANVVIPPSLGRPLNLHFVRWHKANLLFIQEGLIGTKDESEVFIAYTDGVGCLYNKTNTVIKKIPNNYRRIDRRYKPPFFAGDQIEIIINLELDFGTDNFSDVSVCVINNAGQVVHTGISVNRVTCDTINNHYLSFNYPAGVDGRNLYYAIYNTNNEKVYYVSNPFRALSYEDKNCVPYIQYRNSTDLYDSPYECLSAFKNKLRIDFNLIEQNPEIQLKQSREETTGDLRNQRAVPAKVIKLETQFFDDGANDMMLTLSLHSSIIINERTLELKSAYSIENNSLNSKQKGVIEFYDKEFSTINLQG